MILRLFLRPEIGQFSPHFGAISLMNYTENLEKKENNPLEKKKPMETAPRNCRFLSLVVVERVLTSGCLLFRPEPKKYLKNISSGIASQAAWQRMENGPMGKNWPKIENGPRPETGKKWPKNGKK